jgi:hypothetical protein
MEIEKDILRVDVPLCYGKSYSITSNICKRCKKNIECKEQWVNKYGNNFVVCKVQKKTGNGE